MGNITKSVLKLQFDESLGQVTHYRQFCKIETTKMVIKTMHDNLWTPNVYTSVNAQSRSLLICNFVISLLKLKIEIICIFQDFLILTACCPHLWKFHKSRSQC